MKREATGQLCVAECGSACCRTPSMALPLTEREALRLLELAKRKRIPLKPSDFKQGEGHDGPLLAMGPMGRCIFLQHSSGLCRIYAKRPDCCRLFPARPHQGCLVWPSDTPTGTPMGPGVPRPFNPREEKR